MKFFGLFINSDVICDYALKVYMISHNIRIYCLLLLAEILQYNFFLVRKLSCLLLALDEFILHVPPLLPPLFMCISGFAITILVRFCHHLLFHVYNHNIASMSTTLSLWQIFAALCLLFPSSLKTKLKVVIKMFMKMLSLRTDKEILQDKPDIAVTDRKSHLVLSSI